MAIFFFLYGLGIMASVYVMDSGSTVVPLRHRERKREREYCVRSNLYFVPWPSSAFRPFNRFATSHLVYCAGAAHTWRLFFWRQQYVTPLSRWPDQFLRLPPRFLRRPFFSAPPRMPSVSGADNDGHRFTKRRKIKSRGGCGGAILRRLLCFCASWGLAVSH